MRQARQVVFGNIVDEQAKNLGSQIGIPKAAPGLQRFGIDLREAFGQGQSAVRRQPFKQDVGKRLRRHAATRGKVFHSRSEEHTSELQSLMRISYAVFCLKKKKK